MRTLFFLLTIFFVWHSTPAQNPMPSQKEVQAQLQEAKREAASHIAELEKQIADAKKNKEDPGQIREMEEQLATMRKMMGLFAKADTTMVQRPGNLPETKTVLPQYVSPIVKIHLKQPVVAPTKVQARDSMLWYGGRRLNDSMLVTTERTVVLYSRRRNMVVVQPDPQRDSTILNIEANLARSATWTNQYVNNLAATQNSFFNYPQALITMNEFRFIEETYFRILKNTIDLSSPPNSAALVQFPGANTGPAASGGDDIDQPDPIATLRAMHRDMMNHMNNPQQWDASTAPVILKQACDQCDTLSQKSYHARKKQWLEAFLEDEKLLLNKMSAVSALMMSVGIREAYAEIPTLGTDLKHAMIQAFDRWDQKVNSLEQLYANDIRRMEIVIETMLFVENQRKIYYGAVDDSYRARIKNRMDNYIQLLVKHLEDAMTQFDYAEVLNNSMVDRFDRQQKLLSSILGGGVNTALKNLAEKIKRFNRFELDLAGRFEVEHLGTDDLKMIEAQGSFSNPGKVYVSLGRASYDCNWQLYLTNTDYTKPGEAEFRIPVKAERGTKYSYLYNPVRVIMKSYTGPEEMQMVFPYISIKLCDFAAKDSAIVDVFRYKTENLSGYKPGIDEYSVDFLQHINKMFVSAEKTDQNNEHIIVTAFEMLSAATRATIDKATGYFKLDQMQVDFKMSGVQRNLQERITDLTLFPDKLIRNYAGRGSALLFSGRLNVSNREYEGKYNMKAGIISLKVTHAPQ